MLKSCACGSMGTWRSGLMAIVVAVAAGGAAVAMPRVLGRGTGGEGVRSRWVSVSSSLLAPSWVAFGLAEGRRSRGCRTKDRNEELG
jgi:hypothetical protein